MNRRLICAYLEPRSGDSQRNVETLVAGAKRLGAGFLEWYVALQGFATMEAFMLAIQSRVIARDGLPAEDGLTIQEWFSMGVALADEALEQACMGGRFNPSLLDGLDLKEGTYQPDKLPVWVKDPPFEFVQMIEVVVPGEHFWCFKAWDEQNGIIPDGSIDHRKVRHLGRLDLPEAQIPDYAQEFYEGSRENITQQEWDAFREWWIGLLEAMKALAESDDQVVRFCWED